MYMVGAHVVSKFSGMSYQSFVSSRILAPLNMSSTTFSPSKAAQGGWLTQTWTRDARRIPFWFSDEVADLFAGAGGIISNAEDMVSRRQFCRIEFSAFMRSVDEMARCPSQRRCGPPDQCNDHPVRGVPRNDHCQGDRQRSGCWPSINHGVRDGLVPRVLSRT